MEKVYQLHISLKDIKPKIWRRFLVGENINLRELHQVIQTVMGWSDGHLHLFTVKKKEYGEPDEDNDFVDFLDERKATLGKLRLAEKQTFSYVYDFGDNWRHEIKVEKILPADPSLTLPICLEGELACPPEDCGGSWGYKRYRDLTKKPLSELTDEDMESLEWLDDYDFARFSVDDVNEA